MTQLQLDPAILDQLASLKGTVRLCYPDGRVAGDFVPQPAEPASWQRPWISEEELERRSRQSGRPLADILADLEKRAGSSRCSGSRGPRRNWPRFGWQLRTGTP